MRGLKKFLSVILFLVIIVGIIILITKLTIAKREKNMIYGVSFNPEYAAYLGLDFKKAFNKILDDWNFKYIRLSAQWDLVEKINGQYDWSDLDRMMDLAALKNAKVVLVIGHKTPRWPECHTPKWVESLSSSEQELSLENFMKITVERYRNHQALEVWQVENEPFLRFGICKTIPGKKLKEEIVFVKQLDSLHPVIVTDSGELSLWWRTAKQADLFGTTLYRVVWSKLLGYWTYDWIMPPLAYTARLWLNGRDANTAYITELQAEPWIPNKKLEDTSLEDQFKSMNLERLKKNIIFAEKTGMPRAYLWGAEWWYWLESRGSREIADYIKQLKKE
jgi:hypothetical protein